MNRFASVEEQFRLLMGSVTDYSIFFAEAYGTITTWNVGAERILRRTGKKRLQLRAGDVLPMTTDGLTEARRAKSQNALTVAVAPPRRADIHGAASCPVPFRPSPT